MRKDYTDITILLDKSGSMSDCWDQTLKSLNNFLEEQKTVPGQLSVSIYTFDTTRKSLLTTQNVKNVGHISDCWPSGGTALNDALCNTIDDTGKRLSLIPYMERPAKVLFVVLTDGQENSSLKFRKEDVKQRITHQESQYSWNFIFLGADYNAIPDALSYGVQLGNVYNYGKMNTDQEIAKFSHATRSYRSSDEVKLSNFAEQISQY